MAIKLACQQPKEYLTPYFRVGVGLLPRRETIDYSTIVLVLYFT